jgi:pantothenate kinase
MAELIFPQCIHDAEMQIAVDSFAPSWRTKILDLVEQIQQRYTQSRASRFVVAIGGPSGSGKSTSAAVIAHILRAQTGAHALHVSLDGYHYPLTHLMRHTDRSGTPLAAHKGRYDTFDAETLHADLKLFTLGETLSFPQYSRKRHEPIQGAILCNEPQTILILEGLWLLYDTAPWSDIAQLYDCSIFFSASPEFRRTNTISRHVRGGRTLEESVAFYDASDGQNERAILAHMLHHDMEVTIDE